MPVLRSTLYVYVITWTICRKKGRVSAASKRNNVNAISQLYIRHTFRIWCIIHKTRKLLTKLMLKKPNAAGQYEMSEFAEKRKQLHLRSSCPFLVQSISESILIILCALLLIIIYIYIYVWLSWLPTRRFQGDASRKQAETYMMTSWRGIAFRITASFWWWPTDVR